MTLGWHYTKLSLSSSLLLSFSGMCFVFLYLSFCRFCFVLFSCSRWSFVDVRLIFSCPADHLLLLDFFLILSLISLTTADGPHHYHPACGH